MIKGLKILILNRFATCLPCHINDVAYNARQASDHVITSPPPPPPDGPPGPFMMLCSINCRARSQKEAVQHVRELSCARTLAISAFSPQHMRLRLVLWELVSHENACPMMPQGRLGRTSRA